MDQKKKELLKRYILFVISLFISAVGIAVTRKGELGISPLSSLANVVSYQWPEISFGTWIMIYNLLLVAAQLILQGKHFPRVQWLQIPLALVFGSFTDVGVFIASFLEPTAYWHRLALVAAGMVIIALGVSLAVVANVLMNSGEAIVRVIAQKGKWNFGNVKVVFDVSTVAAAVVLSLVLFGGAVIGVREGTVISAVFTGFIVKFFNRRLTTPLEKMLTE